MIITVDKLDKERRWGGGGVGAGLSSASDILSESVPVMFELM